MRGDTQRVGGRCAPSSVAAATARQVGLRQQGQPVYLYPHMQLGQLGRAQQEVIGGDAQGVGEAGTAEVRRDERVVGPQPAQE